MITNELTIKLERLRKDIDGALSLINAGMMITDQSLNSEPGVILLGSWKITPRFPDEKPNDGNGPGAQRHPVQPPLAAETRSLVPDERKSYVDSLRSNLDEAGLRNVVETKPVSPSTARNRKQPGT